MCASEIDFEFGICYQGRRAVLLIANGCVLMVCCVIKVERANTHFHTSEHCAGYCIVSKFFAFFSFVRIAKHQINIYFCNRPFIIRLAMYLTLEQLF